MYGRISVHCHRIAKKVPSRRVAGVQDGLLPYGRWADGSGLDLGLDAFPFGGGQAIGDVAGLGGLRPGGSLGGWDGSRKDEQEGSQNEADTAVLLPALFRQKFVHCSILLVLV
ncbi:MAG: hypothetical protein Kow0080_28070 [Candidatus Promineifilaceae bacterium]